MGKAKAWSPAVLFLALGSLHVSVAQQVTGLTNLHVLQGRARPLLVFAPTPEDARLEIQSRTLAEHAAEASDRDLVLIGLPYNNPGSTQAQLSAADAVQQRRRFHVAPGDFLVILIGKDGGEKLRSDRPLPMSKLTSTIDAMPMRREEMRSGKDKN